MMNARSHARLVHACHFLSRHEGMFSESELRWLDSVKDRLALEGERMEVCASDFAKLQAMQNKVIPRHIARRILRRGGTLQAL